VRRIVLPRLLRAASFRFAALYVALFAASALVLGVAVFLETRSALQNQMADRIETEATFLRGEYGAGGLDHLLDLVRSRGRGASALDYLVEDPAGRHLAGEMPARAGLKPGWTVIEVPQAEEDGGRSEHVRALVIDLGGGLLLAIGSDLGQITAVEEAIASAFLWTVGLAAVLGIGGGVLLSRAFLTRVDAIARTAEAIIGGDLARRVPVRGTDDDLDRLAGTLNRMLDRIGTLLESLRQVSSDIAHDLRTPLTRLYQRLEDARAHARSVAEYEAAVDAALAEAEGLLATFSALLRIAQVEGASSRAGFRATDLSAVVEAVADAYRPDAEAAGHQLNATVAPGITVQGDQELLTQAVANLVENALRHTPAGTVIRVRLTDDPGGGVVLAVEDDGPGVLPEDLPHLTDRFYRGEQSRTTPGNGLGLSLVEAVADLHRARLDIEPLSPGLRVSLAFARSSAPRSRYPLGPSVPIPVGGGDRR
jgi:signal transduction histidine kinase